MKRCKLKSKTTKNSCILLFIYLQEILETRQQIKRGKKLLVKIIPVIKLIKRLYLEMFNPSPVNHFLSSF